ncbi:MAG TPA: DDE-type integrase/transposase/recombinase [Oculatellaceae cyanobacterium]
MNTKRELLQRIRREYRTADKRGKTRLLNSLIDSTGYNRKYAIGLLKLPPREKLSRRRTRHRKYGEEVLDALRQLWRAANGICAKRLQPFLPSLIEALERFDHIKLEKPLKQKLLKMSVSTIERMLKKEREKEPRRVSFTRPGSLLKKQVVVKTFAEWNEQQVGFFEIDLVAHCGGDISGRFIHTLTMTDIATGWTEIVPLLQRDEERVRDGIEQVIEVLPFKLRGIDCDNGAEFLNHKMVTWCKARHITFTRSREYRKNDQAHVEEKNGSIVRRLTGYGRFKGEHAREVMTDFYSVARLYINFFQPSMKLIKKERIGSKVRKWYDGARTPFDRLLSFKCIPPAQRAELASQFRELNPVALLTEMARHQTKLWTLTEKEAERKCPEPATTDRKVVKPKLAEPDQAVRKQMAAQTKESVKQPSAIPKRSMRKPANLKERVYISEEFIESAAHPAHGQIIYRDSKLIGFGLRVTPHCKTFVAETRIGSQLKRITICRADLFSAADARTEAIRLLREMAMEGDELTSRLRAKKR